MPDEAGDGGVVDAAASVDIEIGRSPGTESDSLHDGRDDGRRGAGAPSDTDGDDGRASDFRWDGDELEPLRTDDRFELDEPFTAATSSSASEVGSDRTNTERWAMPVDVDGDGRADVLLERRVEGSRETAIMHRTEAGGWDGPVPLFGDHDPQRWRGTNCISLGDLVGDAAWDLVCAQDQIFVVEGELTESGRTRLLSDRIHVVEAESVNSMFPEQGRTTINQVLIVDIDGDGRNDLLVSTFAVGTPLLAYFNRGDGIWERRDDLPAGQTFGVVPWYVDEQWRYHIMTENGTYAASGVTENRNAVVRFEDDRFVEVFPDRAGDLDGEGYLGPPVTPQYKGTPMGCAVWHLFPSARDGNPLYFCTQNDWSSPLYDSELRNRSADLPGFLQRQLGADSRERALRSRELWALTPTSLVGTWGVDEVLVSSVAGIMGHEVQPPNPAEGRPSVLAYLRTADGVEETGHRLGFVEGAYKTLVVTDLDGDGLPDLTLGGVNGPPALYLNRVEPHGEVVHIRVLGAGHDARITLRDPASGRELHRQVTAFGNPGPMGGPEIFFGVGRDITQLDVTIHRRGRPDQHGRIAADRGMWVFAPDRDPYRP